MPQLISNFNSRTLKKEYDIDEMIFCSFPYIENESNLEYLERQLKCVNNSDLVFHDVEKEGRLENLDKNIPYVLLSTHNDSQSIELVWQNNKKNINIYNIFNLINKPSSAKIIIDDLRTIVCKNYLSFHLNKEYPVSLWSRVQVMEEIRTTSAYYSSNSWKLRDDTNEEYSEIFGYSKRYIYVRWFDMALKDIYTDFQVAKTNQDTIMLGDLANIVRKLESLWLRMSLEPLLIDLLPIPKDKRFEAERNHSPNKLWMCCWEDKDGIRVDGFYYKSIFINNNNSSRIYKSFANSETRISILESLGTYFRNIGVKVFDSSQVELFEMDKKSYELKNFDFNNKLTNLQKSSPQYRGAASPGLRLLGLFFLGNATINILHYAWTLNSSQSSYFISGLTHYASMFIKQPLQNQPENKLFSYPVTATIFAGLGAACLFFNRPTHAAKVADDFVDNIHREQKLINIAN